MNHALAALVRFAPSRLRQFFCARTGLRAIASNSAWLLADRLLRMVVALFVGAWVARHLGPSGYGELAYGLALVSLWQSVSNLGLDSILTREIVRAPTETHRVLGTALRLRVASGLICWIFTVLSVAILRPDDARAIAITAILGATLVFQSSDVVDLWFQSQTQSRVTMFPRSLAYCSASGVKLALIFLDAPLWAFAAAILAETALTAGALAYAYRTHTNSEVWAWDRRRAVTMIHDSLPFMLAGLSTAIYMRVDQLVLRALSSPHELGLYSAILPFSQAWQVIPMVIYASVLPHFSLLKERDPVLYKHRMLQLFSAMLWLGIFVASVTSVVAPWLVVNLLGSAYASSVSVLRWHVFMNVFVFLGVAQSVAIVSDGTSRIALLRTIFGAFVSLGLNLLLIPEWGAIGAAWSAIGAHFCAAVLSNAVLAPSYLRLQLKALWPIHGAQ